MNIRYATMADLDDIASVESVCFPVLEAATKEEFEQRIKYFGNHFWLMFDDGVEQLVIYGTFLVGVVHINQVGSVLRDALVALEVIPLFALWGGLVLISHYLKINF